MKRKGQKEAGGPLSERTPPGKAGAPKGQGHGGNGQDSALEEGAIGNVLRSVYQQAVDEDIPQEMIDLLRKLS